MCYAIIAISAFFVYLEPIFNPLHFLIGKAYKVENNVIIGPYPHYNELKKLKKRFGVDYDISLLDSDIPPEKFFLEEESKNCKLLEIKFLNFPMFYRPLRTKEHIATATAIAHFILNNKDKKFYIHCYRGINRAGLVRDVLENYEKK